ncbi:hypothetical protein [Nocardioides sp. CER19]|uniref:hypothetical protein n=1 Tax=Nocardioides sp. CER19 TaxID=3038538 RepID=UPI002447EEA8|nr:hypothetical protein [Nocardioides sp. CER19]MDH2416560.1 hypothetical protein [Nocardioides sp. CER19]
MPQVGMRVVFVALWRARAVAWPYLAVAVELVTSAVIGSGRVETSSPCSSSVSGSRRFLATDR